MGRTKQRTPAMHARLLSVALDLLVDDGPAAVTTRAVAAGGGASLAAVDELFGGKPGLLRALAIDGFARLASALDDLGPPGDPEPDLIALAMAVRRFALERWHQYELMFSRPIAELEPDRDELATADAIYRHVLVRVAAVLGADRRRGEARDAAIGVVATVRGLVELERARVLGSTHASIERRWRSAVLAMVRGSAGGGR